MNLSLFAKSRTHRTSVGQMPCIPPHLMFQINLRLRPRHASLRSDARKLAPPAITLLFNTK